MAALVGSATRLTARYRHGSQAFRLTLMALGLVVPAAAFYPSVFQIGWQAKSQLVETRYASQAVNQRQTIQLLLQDTLDQIDQFPGLLELAALPAMPVGGEPSTDRAFQVWRLTALAEYPVTSSVELHGADGLLVSRFAFNLPDDLTAVPRSDEQVCSWGVFEEVSPFFAEERRILHAGRAICAEDGRPAGSIIVHAILDYANLPFIQSQNPYVELMRPLNPTRGEGIAGRDVEFAFYGWSRTPLYGLRPNGVAAGRRGIRADRTDPCAGVGQAAARGHELRRVPPQRPRWDLRPRVSGRVTTRPPREPGGDHHARLGHLSSVDSRGSRLRVGHSARNHRARAAA